MLLFNKETIKYILSKNDWERPIYFTGGSYKDSEYLWMKNYLKLKAVKQKKSLTKLTTINLRIDFV